MANGFDPFGADFGLVESGDAFSGDESGILGGVGVSDFLGGAGSLGQDVSGFFTEQVSGPPMVVPRGGSSLPPMVGMMIRKMPPIVQSAIAKMARALQRRGITVQAAIALGRRIGIPGLVALGLTIAEIAALFLWGSTHRRRRMNVLNPKALSRSTRRLLGFQRRAGRVEMALSGICRTRRRGSKARRGACVVCHRNPCACP